MGEIFNWPIRVYYEDTDLGGVVYHARYQHFMERARTELLRSLGVEQDEVLEQRNLLFVIVEADLKYLKPARFNDLLSVTAEVTERRRGSMRFLQRILRGGVDGELLCEGRVRVACVEAGSFRPRRIPTDLIPGA